jgi:hypothetical protein
MLFSVARNSTSLWGCSRFLMELDARAQAPQLRPMENQGIDEPERLITDMDFTKWSMHLSPEHAKLLINHRLNKK